MTDHTNMTATTISLAKLAIALLMVLAGLLICAPDGAGGAPDPMTYQKRLFASFLFTIVMLAAVCGAMLIVTSCQESKYPNVITTMPNLK